MVAKFLGFLIGAGVAGAAVFGFYAWRTVSDLDRLETVLLDHCLPFVETGEVPFEGMGRPVGVYDNAGLEEDISGSSNAIIFDNRLVAQWGEQEVDNAAARVCQVSFLGERTDGSGLVIDSDRVWQWAETNLVDGLGLQKPQTGFGEYGTNAFVWLTADAPASVGLRVHLIFQETSVLRVKVVNDLP